MGKNKCSRQIPNNTVTPAFHKRSRRLCECYCIKVTGASLQSKLTEHSEESFFIDLTNRNK